MNPVTQISEIGSIEIDGDRAIISLDSHGANVRLSLSRHSSMMLSHRLADTAKELFDQPQPEIIEFPRNVAAN